MVLSRSVVCLVQVGTPWVPTLRNSPNVVQKIVVRKKAAAVCQALHFLNNMELASCENGCVARPHQGECQSTV